MSRWKPTSSLINPDFAKDIGLAEKLKGWRADGQDCGLLSDQEWHIRQLVPVGLVRGMEGFDVAASRYGIEASIPGQIRI